MLHKKNLDFFPIKFVLLFGPYFLRLCLSYSNKESFLYFFSSNNWWRKISLGFKLFPHLYNNLNTTRSRLRCDKDWQLMVKTLH